MTHFKKAFSAALVAAFAFAFVAPISAQAQTDTTQEASQAQMQQQEAPITSEALMSATKNMSATLQKAKQLGEVSSVSAVSASSVLEGEQLDAFNKATESADTEALRSYVSGQAALTGALSKAQMTAEDVVSLAVPSEGSVVLVTR